VDRLPLIDREERDTLVVEWNQTEMEVEEGVCVHQMFEAWVDRDPDRMAVVAEDGSITYGELEARANRLAHRLLELGVGREDLIGVSLPRTTDMVVAVMGILKAGGAYLPLDPDLPSERLLYMLEDGDVGVVVSYEELAESFSSFQGETICLDTDRSLLQGLSDRRPEVPTEPDQLAYVLYTSGSTGQPKGVEVCHPSIINIVAAMGHQLELGADDCLLACVPLSFDPSVFHIFGTMTRGARVILAPKGIGADGERFKELIGKPGITLVGISPPGWRSLLSVGWEGNPNIRAWTGSEPVPPDLARAVVSRCKMFWNYYGPTEATLAATSWRFPEDVEQVRIGTPLPNYQAYVLDRWMEPVPIGVPGELYLGGRGVARGYRNRPELTAERFVPDPFSGRPRSRLYRTGDRARFRDDGTVEFLGRLDHQVKIRGYRIELGEIEARLAEHEAVRQVAVVVRGEGIDAGLVAYVSFNSGEGFSSSEMREFLRRSLPDYMVPANLVILDELPLTHSNKIDRRALPPWDPAERQSTTEFVPPETEIEEQLAGIWRELLKVDRIGTQDDFFELGGHSLMATQVVSRIRAVCGAEVPLRSIFQHPTIASLAPEVVKARAESVDPDALAEMLASLGEGS
jgi:amino acid adenylation domain-containing protein